MCWCSSRLNRPSSMTKHTAPTTPKAAISLRRMRHDPRSRSSIVGGEVLSMMSGVYPCSLCVCRAAPITTLRRVDQRTGLPVVGMVGAGQLARMTHQAAIALGQSLRVLAAAEDDAAALVAPDVLVGDWTRYPDLARFAAGCDVVTFDHEHVPADHLRALAAAGHAL